MAVTPCDRALLTLEHIVASSERTVPGTLSSVTDSWFQAPQNVISFSSLLVCFADGGQMAALRHTAAGLKQQPDVSSRGRSEADRLLWEILHNLRAINEQCSWGLSWNHDLMSSWAQISALKSSPYIIGVDVTSVRFLGCPPAVKRTLIDTLVRSFTWTNDRFSGCTSTAGVTFEVTFDPLTASPYLVKANTLTNVNLIS